MPSEFETLNRGKIAFGFFNTETDMVLLDRVFIFAETLCELVGGLAQQKESGDYQNRFEAYHLERPENVGDVIGAIHGVNRAGFIGAIYERFPFPESRDEFRQKPDGRKTRGVVESIMQSFGTRKEFLFLFDSSRLTVGIGDYQFDQAVFGQLVRYIYEGGYRGWRNDVRPDYVDLMMKEIVRSNKPFFKG